MESVLDEMTAERFCEIARRGPLPELPDGWWNRDACKEAHRRLARQFLEAVPEYPDRFRGRGIVICAGGGRLFANGYVCVRMLRHLGCALPVQFWHLEAEMDDAMRQLVAPLGVTCVDASRVDQDSGRPRRCLSGWELKAFALLHCPYREVLLLDADNVPVVDPAFLFETPEYARTGAIFWPDYGRLEPFRDIWPICEVPYRDEPEFESGQIVVDKRRCWRALQLAMHYNEHSDFYYRHIHGDKETFHLAFHRTGTPYEMPPFLIHALDATMCQHDFGGRRIFQHRNMDKWRLDGTNHQIHDFWFEDVCRQFLAELRARWSGRVYWGPPEDEGTLRAFEEVADRVFRYERVGYDARDLELRRDGEVGRGAAECEQYWSAHRLDGEITLSILGEDQPTCHLRREGGAWRGRWLRHERMPITLTPVGSPTSTDDPLEE